jgi:hypothetical protein
MTFTRGASVVTVKGDVYPLTLTEVGRQNFGITESGAVAVFNWGVRKQFYGLNLADDHDNHDDIRDFFRTTTQITYNTFSWDRGFGAALTVRFWGGSLLEEMKSFQHYNYDIVLRVE